MKSKKQTGPKGLRMKELCEATGLPKSTLLYYVDQGLLPQPEKTSPNMAFYPPECVERAALIRQLQSDQRLPLAKIKSVLEAHDRGEDITPLLMVNQVIFGDREEPLMTLEEFCANSGLSPEQVSELEKAQLLMPLYDQGYDAQDLAMAQVLARGAALGLTPEDASFYTRLAKQLVDAEMALRHRLTHSLPMAQDASLTAAMVQSARIMRGYVIERVFQKRVAASQNLKDESLLS
ncbi:MAG: MerR family transcriptional regulator [Pseudomonadota bacterium]